MEDHSSAASTWFIVVDDESTAELSKLLDQFGTPPPPVKVRFVDNPYSSHAVFHSSDYVAIDVNDESCGSSFTVADTSSFMACFDVGGGGGWKG